MKRLGLLLALAFTSLAHADQPYPATFSIVAADPETGEVGVAVASKFFAVGAVVPWAKAGVGAVATQAMANVGYGPRGLDLMEKGVSADEAVKVMTRADSDRELRQMGIVSAAGDSATYTGEKCVAWAGGRSGRGYAVQGNIIAGEDVVIAMEKAFLESKGKHLADRLYVALVAGDAKGGDSRGRQSASLLVVREKGGFLGFTDRSIDVRVDDHPDPIAELGRLMGMALVVDDNKRFAKALNDKKFAEALAIIEHAVALAEKQPSGLPGAMYNLACARLAMGDRDGARQALDRAFVLDPKLREIAQADPDLAGLR